MVSLLGGTVHRPLRASRRSSFVKRRTAASRNGRAKDVLNARFTALCAVALVMLAVSVRAALAQTKPSVPTATEELSRSTEALARLVSPAVVQIFTTSYVPAEGVVARAADLVTSLNLTMFIDSKLELSHEAGGQRIQKGFSNGNMTAVVCMNGSTGTRTIKHIGIGNRQNEECLR